MGIETVVDALADRIVERKIKGDHDSRLAEKICALGVDESTALSVISRVVSDHLASERKLLRWKRRIESLLDAHREMRQLDPDVSRIRRLHKPDPEHFLREYYAKGQPVILTGLLDDWPALSKWSPDYLRRQHGEVLVEIMLDRDQDENYEINRDEHRRKILLRDFVELVQSKSSNDAYMVAHNFAFSGPLAALSDDIDEVPGILRKPDNLTEINFWFGPAGTVTPLHHDDANVLLAQMWGEKQVTVYPWAEIYLLYNEIAAFSRFDPDTPDFSRFPLAARATKMTGTLHQGDALFMPVGTWHKVRATSASISLSMSQFVFPNRYTIHTP